MGYMAALDMAQQTDRRTALTWHLRSNHYPPHPLYMVGVAEAALDAYAEGTYDTHIELPEDVTYKGQSSATPIDIIESLHLEAFIQEVSDEG